MALDDRSVTWRYAGDLRFALLLGRAFLLQVMHPTIAAGVADHSTFASDPWGRLFNSWELVLRTVYEPDGAQVGAAVRAAHKSIRGVDGEGHRYHAFEPEAYWWVLATGFDTLCTFAERFAGPLSEPDRRRAYAENRELGRRFGLRERDMPAGLEDFVGWYDEIVGGRLENTPTAHRLLAVMRRAPPPPRLPAIVWPLPRALAAHGTWLVTIGTLPPAARELLGIRWDPAQELQLNAISLSVRAAGAIPGRWRYLPPARRALSGTR
jgi:uncharacterized protein (DUF2236 family)